MSLTPWHSLADAKALVAADKFILAETSALARILPHLRLATAVGARNFAKAVFALLQASDFSRQVKLPKKVGKGVVVYDAYAKKIAKETAAAHLDSDHKTTWYTKLTIINATARHTFVLSLHCLEKPEPLANRTTLIPTWKESE